MSREKVLVVDGNSILNRAFYGIRALSTKDGQPTNAIYGLVNIVSRQFERIAPQYAVMAFDLKAPTFRHKMYDLYKAGRKPAPEELLAQFVPAKLCAEAIGFHVVEREGFEADDILGTIAAYADAADCDCYLLTGDRDALQLIDERIHVLLATNNDTVDFTEDVFYEKYGVRPSQFVDVKALMGDTSDHIPGVPGIGEKTAFKLIADYVSLDRLYQSLPEAELTPSVRAKLEAGKESAELSRTLALICREVPLGGSLEPFRTSGVNREAALELFTKYEFSDFIKRMNLTGASNNETAAVPVTASTDRAELRTVRISELPSTSEPLAFCLREDAAQFYDGKDFFRLPAECYASEAGRGEFEAYLNGCPNLVCYDCKALYHKADELGIRFRNCKTDVMLAAYVVSAGDGSFDLDRLALSYLNEALSENEPETRTIYRLYPILNEKVESTGQGKILREIEMPLAAVLADMEKEGFHINQEGIKSYGSGLGMIAQDLESRIYLSAGRSFNINSPKQLGEVLFDDLKLPGGKKSKKTGAYSTNAEILEKLRPYHPIIEDILDYRQVSKLKSTYVDGLIKVVASDGQIHTNFKQTGTVTGRLSSSEPNLQNIPIRTELGRELRRFFTPRKDGYVLIDADYSQIELRLLAAISGDETMKDAFLTGKDIHTSTAATVFGVEPDDVSIELRKRAKAINFGILYGMGEFSLSDDLHISIKQAKEYIENYLATYPKIDAYLESVKANAARDGYVTTMLGRRRYIPELSSSNKMIQKFGERVAMNSPIQGSAADIIKIAMIAVDRRLKESGIDAKLILQVHDELLIEAKKDCADEALAMLREEMEHAASVGVPLDVSVAVGENWFDAK